MGGKTRNQQDKEIAQEIENNRLLKKVQEVIDFLQEEKVKDTILILNFASKKIESELTRRIGEKLVKEVCPPDSQI